MSPKQAIARLRTLLGKHAAYRIDEKAPTPAQRAEAAAKLPALRAARNELEARMTSRREELLRDPLYRELKEKYQQAKKQCDEAGYAAHMHYRLTVGTSGEFFFHVEAQGDNWSDVIAKLEAKRAERAIAQHTEKQHP